MEPKIKGAGVLDFGAGVLRINEQTTFLGYPIIEVEQAGPPLDLTMVDPFAPVQTEFGVILLWKALHPHERDEETP